jgi:hypothetical protein
VIFYQVKRQGRRYGLPRIVYEGDNRARAEAAYQRAYLQLHSGFVLLLADGEVERRFSGGYNRTRW